MVRVGSRSRIAKPYRGFLRVCRNLIDISVLTPASEMSILLFTMAFLGLDSRLAATMASGPSGE